MRVLLDGWQLIYNPLSAAAFHALEILEVRRENVELILALPDMKPQWLAEDLQIFEIMRRPPSALNHLRWVQVDIPRVAGQVKADLIHSVQASVPLFASQAVIYSPTERFAEKNQRKTFWGRLDEAFGLGGASRAVVMESRGIFGDNDRKVEIKREGVFEHRAFSSLNNDFFSVPQTPYFLYHSFGDWNRLQLILKVWSKTTAHLGDQASLAVICADTNEQKKVKTHSSSQFLQTLHLFAEVTPPQWIVLLRNAIALIQLEDEPLWGGVARRAIGQGVPVIGFETPSLDDAVGEAGYLVPEGDERSLSAALMTLVVEEEMLQNLRGKAQQQARCWDQGLFCKGLLRFYRQAVSRKP